MSNVQPIRPELRDIHAPAPLRDLLQRHLDLARLVAIVDSPANGLTLCSGSLGADLCNNIESLVREFGGQLLHVINKASPDLGPDPRIKLRELERELLVPADLFKLYDALDAIVGEEAFCEALS